MVLKKPFPLSGSFPPFTQPTATHQLSKYSQEKMGPDLPLVALSHFQLFSIQMPQKQQFYSSSLALGARVTSNQPELSAVIFLFRGT
jgi:hypothetical protein